MRGDAVALDLLNGFPMFSCFSFAVAGTKCFLADFYLRPSALAVHLVHISGQMFQDSAQTFTDLAFGFLLNVGLSSTVSKLCLSHLSLHFFQGLGGSGVCIHSVIHPKEVKGQKTEEEHVLDNPNKSLQTMILKGWLK